MSDNYLISLEDHFVSSRYQPSDVAKRLGLHQFPGPLLERLVDVGQKRISTMNEAKVQLQVVSHVPFAQTTAECIEANNELYTHCRKGEHRLAGFAALPVAEPCYIADELLRCCKELGFLGALIPNHAHGKYYDGEEYEALWSTAEELDVPVYLHPCLPNDSKMQGFGGAYSGDVTFSLATHAWDWHADCGLHFARLYAAGVFERHPRLKLVLGHLGELIPFMLGRLERKLALTSDAKAWTRSIRAVFAENVWITTTGMFDKEAWKLAMAVTAPDRVLFSIDYPFEDSLLSMQFLECLLADETLSEAEFKGVACENAEALLKIKKARDERR